MKEHTSSVIIVILAGLIWSFGAVVVKNMTDPQSYQLPYLIIRGFTVAVIVGSYLFVKDKKDFVSNLVTIDRITIYKKKFHCNEHCFFWNYYNGSSKPVTWIDIWFNNRIYF